MEKCEEEAESLDEKQAKLNKIHKVKEVFGYVLFFDNVRNIENFKSIDSLKEIIEKIIDLVNSDYEIKNPKDVEDKLYKEVKSNMIDKDVFLEKFETDEFSLSFEATEFNEDLYNIKLQHNVKMPMQYSERAIEKVFTEGIIAEDKLQIEYILLSTIAIRDIVNGNFKDAYIAEFEPSLFKKKQKLNGILDLISNQALQEKINLNISYSDYKKNQKNVLDYTSKGYNFVITLDEAVKSVEDVEKLKMFKLVIAPKDLVLYKQIKEDNSLTNVMVN